MDFRLPVPRNWQDFESICHRLWIEIWNDPNTQKNGRQGQKQNGVDIIGTPIYSNLLSAVQCKDKDGHLGSVLKAEELKSECDKAKFFLPKIASFTLATTAPRNALIQRTARQLTKSKSIPFTVQVWSWDDIQSEIAFRPSIMDAYYFNFAVPWENANTITLNRFSPKEQFYAYFHRPNVISALSNKFKEDLIPLLYELMDNSYTHGKATRFDITLKDRILSITDDGLAFNPTTELNHNLVSAGSHIGSFVFYDFVNKYTGHTELDYSRATSNNQSFNKLEIKLPGDVELLDEDDFIELCVDLKQSLGRLSANALALSLSITDDIKEVLWTVTPENGGYMYSFVAQFIQSILLRLNTNQRLIVSLPRNHMFRNMQSWFKDSRLKFIIR